MAGKEYSSRFSDVINTNLTVAQQDAEEIKALLNEPRQELAELDAEMTRLRTRMEELGNRYQTVATFVSSHYALISPFRRLPEDVMTEIFLRCLPTDRNPTRSVEEAPLLLTRINRKCRDVVLSSPRLWSALHVYVPYFDEGHERESKSRLKRRAEGIEAWLNRSGSLPLNLSVVVSPYSEPSRGSAYKSLIHVLASFSPRWGKLLLSVPTSFMKELERRINTDDLACLRSLQIDYSKQSIRYGGPGHINILSHQSLSQDIEFTQVLSKAPQVRSLVLQNYKSNVLKLPITWDRLTRLELNSRNSHQTAEELFVVLRVTASSLESCSVTLYCPNSTPDAGNEESPRFSEISFPNLHTLKVHIAFAPQFGGQPYSLDAPAAFFSSIAAPSLVNFTFTIYPLPSFGFFDHVPFLAMINKSDSKIETFFLAFPVTTAALTECLQLLPSLKTIVFSECLWAITHPNMQNGFPAGFPSPVPLGGRARINACAVTDSFMSSLTRSYKNRQPLCPNLESVTIAGAIAVSETTMIRFAQSRSPSRISSGFGVEGEGEDGIQGDGKEEANHLEPGCFSTSPVTPLKHLTVHYDRETKRGKVNRSGEVRDSVIYPQIEKLRTEEGMKVAMTYPSPVRHHDSPWGGQVTGPGTNNPFGGGYDSVAVGPGGGGPFDDDEDGDDLFSDLDDEEAMMMEHDHHQPHVGAGPLPLNLQDLFGGGGIADFTNVLGTVFPMNG